MTGMVCILVDFKLRWANKPYINLKNTVRYPRSGKKYKIVPTLGDLIINAARQLLYGNRVFKTIQIGLSLGHSPGV